MGNEIGSKGGGSSALSPAQGLRYLGVAISLLLAALLAVFSNNGPFERSFQDLRDGINSKPASGDIHIVEIDAKSLAELHRWPWPRSNHAKLVDRLVDANVEQIVFDIDFSSRSSDAEDAAFAAAINRAEGKVVLPTFRQPAGHGQSNREVENLPLEIFRQKAFLGSVNVRPDSIGQVNNYPFGTITEATARPSIGAMLAGAKGPVNKEFSLNHAIDIETIPRHSFVDILEGRVDKTAIRGKRIIVGATAIEMGDRYATARYGVVPGVVIQALAAETLMAGGALPEFGAWPLLLVALAVVLAAVGLLGRSGPVGSALAAATIFLLAVVAERLSIAHLKVAPALLFLSCTAAAHYVVGMVQKLSKERNFDRETGLPNLNAWRTHMDGSGELAFVIVAEIANFGEILSILGETESTRFFQAVADRLEVSSGGGNLYRIGREHFCWKMESRDSQDIDSLLESTSVLFNAPLLVNGRSIRATLCFGIAKCQLSDPVDTANKATLAAKRAAETGARSIWHDDRLAHDADQSLVILSEFEEALMTGQISVLYQPKYSFAAQRVRGAEALVRWHHPERGTISPDIFVPVLERENLIEPLTLFVIRQALEDMTKWNVFGQNMGCAINISASLLAHSAFADRAIAIIAKSNVDPRLITFELTETAVLSSLELAGSTFDRFKKLGVRLSIDDYGTGQSTLSYLKNFLADEIKIDQSFVKMVATDNASRIMVRSSIEMAHALGFSVVAEGVEDEEAMEILREYGCDMVQGWHIGKAISQQDFTSRWCRVEPGDLDEAHIVPKAMGA
jgi:diguanylate cyclase